MNLECRLQIKNTSPISAYKLANTSLSTDLSFRKKKCITICQDSEFLLLLMLMAKLPRHMVCIPNSRWQSDQMFFHHVMRVTRFVAWNIWVLTDQSPTAFTQPIPHFRILLAASPSREKFLFQVKWIQLQLLNKSAGKWLPTTLLTEAALETDLPLVIVFLIL